MSCLFFPFYLPLEGGGTERVKKPIVTPFLPTGKNQGVFELKKRIRRSLENFSKAEIQA